MTAADARPPAPPERSPGAPAAGTGGARVPRDPSVGLSSRQAAAAMRTPFGSPVLDAAVRMLVPFILLFAAYVVVHGHTSPGGGFQGGTLCAAALIVVRLVRGSDVGWGIDPRAALTLATSGVAIYAGIGVLGILFGGTFLDYGALPLPLEGGALRAMGSFGVEVGVALGVTGVLVLVFQMLVGEVPPDAFDGD